MSGRELTLAATAAELDALSAEVAWRRAIDASQRDTGNRALGEACHTAMERARTARSAAGEAWRKAADARREAQP